MKIYDISQELVTCAVYPGDKSPKKEVVFSMDNNDLYNLTNISLCTHNGTHIDAPCHFIRDGKSVSDISLEKFVGECYVISHTGDFDEKDALALLSKDENPRRILIKGNATITREAARVFADNNIYLIGNESQTVGPESSPMEVHKILLSKEIVLLEGIRLKSVKEGKYFLVSAPINIAGSDGAPCRAILIDFD